MAFTMLELRLKRSKPAEAAASEASAPVAPPPGLTPADLVPLMDRIAMLERQVLALTSERTPDAALWRGQPPLITDAQPGTGVVPPGMASREEEFPNPGVRFLGTTGGGATPSSPTRVYGRVGNTTLPGMKRFADGDTRYSPFLTGQDAAWASFSSTGPF